MPLGFLVAKKGDEVNSPTITRIEESNLRLEGGESLRRLSAIILELCTGKQKYLCVLEEGHGKL